MISFVECFSKPKFLSMEKPTTITSNILRDLILNMSMVMTVRAQNHGQTAGGRAGGWATYHVYE